MEEDLIDVAGDSRRRFRQMGNFSGSEQEWKEFGLKICAVVEETEPELFKAMRWAVVEENDITDDSIQGNCDEEQAIRMTTMFFNRLIHHLKGAAFTIHQGSWARTDPMTQMRGMQIMLKVMLLPKIGKNRYVHTQVNKWESLINILEEEVSHMMKVGLLLHMMPDDLQDTTLQHADRFREYRLVKEKAVNLVDARARLRDPNAMNVGYCGYHEEEEEYGQEADERRASVRTMREDGTWTSELLDAPPSPERGPPLSRKRRWSGASGSTSAASRLPPRPDSAGRP